MGDETVDERAVAASFGTQLRDSPHTGPVRWTECDDLEVTDDGRLLYAGPRYLRCTRAECHHLVTHGMIALGGCWCGNRRLGVAFRLTTEEKNLLKRGYYPLMDWEAAQIQPILPSFATTTGWGKAEWSKRYA